MDLRLSLPNGDVIRYFAIALTEQNDGTYQVELHGVEYHQNPFREPYYGEWALEYTINTRCLSIIPPVAFSPPG